jgi:hypothetical protein
MVWPIYEDDKGRKIFYPGAEFFLAPYLIDSEKNEKSIYWVFRVSILAGLAFPSVIMLTFPSTGDLLSISLTAFWVYFIFFAVSHRLSKRLKECPLGFDPRSLVGKSFRNKEIKLAFLIPTMAYLFYSEIYLHRDKHIFANSMLILAGIVYIFRALTYRAVSE